MHFFINFRVRHVLMLFVKWLGNLRREHRLIFGKVRRDRCRHDWRRPLRRCCVLRRQSRSLILTLIPTLTLALSLVLGDRFAGKQYRLIPRGRSVIVVATGTSSRRRSLESRVRSAASRTLAAIEAVVPWFDTRFAPCFAGGITACFVSWFASNFASVCTYAASAPVSGFFTTSATTTASAKVARSSRGVARHFGRSCFRLFPVARYASGF